MWLWEAEADESITNPHTVLDCGLVHTFHTGERTEYVASLAS
jgi:hypothetical protein